MEELREIRPDSERAPDRQTFGLTGGKLAHGRHGKIANGGYKA